MADSAREWFVQGKIDPHPRVQVYAGQKTNLMPTSLYIPRSWLATGVVGQYYVKHAIHKFTDNLNSS